jgi:hypothetical protein
MDEEALGLGDSVRIRDTEATRQFGLAWLRGQVCGDTIPSVTGAEVIGDPGGDYAIAVRFEDRSEPYWFAPELLELLERAVEIRDPNVAKAIEALYAAFAAYGPQQDFCAFCYTEDEIEYLRSTPVRNLSEECARKLLWEANDHWQSADAYRHYLPRILDVFAPPISCDDIYEGISSKS